METRPRSVFTASALGGIAVLVVIVGLIAVLQLVFSAGSSSSSAYTYANFVQDLRSNRVTAVDVRVNDQTMAITLSDGSVRTTGYVDASGLGGELANHRAVHVTSARGGSSPWPTVLRFVLPVALVVVVLVVLLVLRLRKRSRAPVPGFSFPVPGDADLRSMLVDLGRRVECLEDQLNRHGEAPDR